MGAALVLDTAAAIPDRRKFSLNPSFALVLLVFAMILVGYVVVDVGMLLLTPAWLPVMCDQMMEPENMENA